MKKIMLTTVFAALMLLNFAQVSTPSNPPVSKADLLLKSKKQKTAAWVCLGGGLGLAGLGLILSVPKGADDLLSLATLSQPQSNYTGETILMIVGGAAVIGSVPLFTASSKNARKAKLMVTNQKTAAGLSMAIPKSITGLTVSISL